MKLNCGASLFGQRVKELREERQLSQRELAKELGFGNSNICGEWERRNKEPSYITLAKVAKYFDVSSDYLIGLDD